MVACKVEEGVEGVERAKRLKANGVATFAHEFHVEGSSHKGEVVALGAGEVLQHDPAGVVQPAIDLCVRECHTLFQECKGRTSDQVGAARSLAHAVIRVVVELELALQHRQRREGCQRHQAHPGKATCRHDRHTSWLCCCQTSMQRCVHACDDTVGLLCARWGMAHTLVIKDAGQKCIIDTYSCAWIYIPRLRVTNI